MRLKKQMALTSLVLGMSLLQACSTLHTTPTASLDKKAQWVLLPATNNTETTHASANSEAIFELADRRNQENALTWAKKSGAKYAVAGSVDEWRYKVGLDGEPAAGITLNVIDLESGQVVWSGTAAKTGWSREAVSAIAQKVVDNLLKSAINP